MSDVTFTRDDYTYSLPDWTLVQTVTDGQRAVKQAGKTYLPDPNMVPEGDTQRQDVYKSYLQRASFFNVTGQTLESLTGTAFAQAPTLTVPTVLEYVQDDIDGGGVSIYQQSQAVLGEVLKKGRCALWVDYPATETPASLADQQSGKIRATVLEIDAERVINWRYEKVGAKVLLSLVVFTEERERSDEFASETETIYRVLRLTEGVYTVETWARTQDGSAFVFESSIIPRDGAGNGWAYIPFYFVGSQNNDGNIDKAPMLDLANLNIKHYQVAADWYNALYFAGQPQPVAAGLSESWRDWLEKNGVVLGSRAPLLLPAGASFNFAVVPADTAIQSELEKLEKRMQAIGARLITPGEVAMTATQSRDQNIAQHSVLSLVAQNVAEAYTTALNDMARYMNAPMECEYILATTYVEHTVDANLLNALIAANQAGKLTDADLFAAMRRFGLVDQEKTDESIREELSTQGGSLDLGA